ncbi:MAG: cupredoxin domain-containing protein [Gemmatimonadaceae bacterium]
MHVSRLLVAACIVVACGGDSDDSTGPGSGGPPGPTATVQANNQLQFTPNPVSVLVGGTVTFAFAATAHNVFFDATAGAPANIPGNNANVSISRTFPTAGSFRYECQIHPGMSGRVNVQ